MGTNLSFRLIPRKTFNARRNTQVLDSYNLPTNPAPSNFTVENAGLQPTTGNKATATTDGYTDKEMYCLFTTTELQQPDEGSNDKGDEVEVFPNRWATVLRVEPWQYGLQSHYKVTLVMNNER